MKEQREQDQRRHEQQVQQLQAELRVAQQTIVVKQEDVTRLNQDGVRLVAELTHARGALHEAKEHGRRTAQRLEALQAVEQHNSKLAAQLAGQTGKVEALAAQMRDLELTLAQSQARHETQQGIVTELRTYLEGRQQPEPKG